LRQYFGILNIQASVGSVLATEYLLYLGESNAITKKGRDLKITEMNSKKRNSDGRNLYPLTLALVGIFTFLAVWQGLKFLLG
jgi:hypothetical protein